MNSEQNTNSIAMTLHQMRKAQQEAKEGPSRDRPLSEAREAHNEEFADDKSSSKLSSSKSDDDAALEIPRKPEPIDDLRLNQELRVRLGYDLYNLYRDHEDHTMGGLKTQLEVEAEIERRKKTCHEEI